MVSSWANRHTQRYIGWNNQEWHQANDEVVGIKQVPTRQYGNASVPLYHFVDECKDRIHGGRCQ
jgi:hypothetical protein